ncbi:MAG: flagellar assembly protein FliW [Desulfobulbaceae bacterium]|uniref:Flagellar assembly factor FliW n=1 Tax=Candidatus Desulfobia pelagia TaxID=2841692 RepID=A0A8J6TFY1_9BACT|nr:flagellar assembly protein FliW [Candidatus Desulfobia pelagia]
MQAEKNKVQTSRFGEIEVDRDRIISMTSPFPGFPDSSRFLLLPSKPDSPFLWLQSMDDPELAFVIIHAALLDLDYTPPIPASVQEELKIQSEQDQEILTILTIPQGKPREMTANLLGPVILNSSKRLAKQIVLDPNKYDLCWPVFGEKQVAK